MIRSIRQFFYLLFKSKELETMAVLRYGTPTTSSEWICCLPDNLIINIYRKYTENTGTFSDPKDIKAFFHIITKMQEKTPILFERKKAMLLSIIRKELILNELNFQ